MSVCNRTGQLFFVSNLPNIFSACARQIISCWNGLILRFSDHPLSHISLSLGKQVYNLRSLLFTGRFKNPSLEEEMEMNSEILGKRVHFHPFLQQFKPESWILHPAIQWIYSCLRCTGLQMQRLLADQLAELFPHCLAYPAVLQGSS